MTAVTTRTIPELVATASMSITFRVQPERRLLETRIEGDVHLDEVLRYMRELDATEDYDPTFDALVDVRGVQATVDTNGLHTIASRVRARPRDAASRRAVVADVNVVYGVMRMFEAYVEDSPTEYRVFRSMDEALDWLGIDASELVYLTPDLSARRAR